MVHCILDSKYSYLPKVAIQLELAYSCHSSDDTASYFCSPVESSSERKGKVFLTGTIACQSTRRKALAIHFG